MLGKIVVYATGNSGIMSGFGAFSWRGRTLHSSSFFSRKKVGCYGMDFETLTESFRFKWTTTEILFQVLKFYYHIYFYHHYHHHQQQ